MLKRSISISYFVLTIFLDQFKMPRGTSWTQQEDLDLCQHWIAASEDPVKGTYQKKDTLWATILNGMGTERTSSAVQNRWSDISRDVLKFIGILTQLLKIYKSGWGVIEYEAQAAIAFKKEQGDDFRFKHCYEFLKDKKRFTTPSSAITSPPTNTSSVTTLSAHRCEHSRTIELQTFIS